MRRERDGSTIFSIGSAILSSMGGTGGTNEDRSSSFRAFVCFLFRRYRCPGLRVILNVRGKVGETN